MSGFFKKLFNRVTGRKGEDVEAEPAPAAQPQPEPAPALEQVLEQVEQAPEQPREQPRKTPKAKPAPASVKEVPASPAPPPPPPRPKARTKPKPKTPPKPDTPTPAPAVPAPQPVIEPSLPPRAAPEAEAAPKPGWLGRLRQGLAKSSRSLSGGITDIFTKRKLDASTLEDLEDVLIQGDLGVETAARITAAVAKGRYDKEIDPGEVRSILADEVEKVLRPVEVPFTFDETQKPFVILVVGVNGTGKTTTIGKLGAIAVAEGFSVLLAACDTFRAAAIEQLAVWGERIGARVISRPTGSDAAGLAFDALAEARRTGTDIVFIDTAGRLHNKAVLMDELEKVVRVVRKQDASAPHAVLLVLDATTGQNAIAQADAFTRVAGVTGIVMTKLDGTARGGILVAIAERFKLPVHAVGVGETIDDLQPFDAAAFARAIAGIDVDEEVA